MTKRTPTHRTRARRSRRIYVTTQLDEQPTVKLAQLLTSAALEQARLEVAAEAEHKALTPGRDDQASDAEPAHGAVEEASDA